MLATIMFDGIEIITFQQRFNLKILLEESRWDPYFLVTGFLVTTNFCKIY